MIDFAREKTKKANSSIVTMMPTIGGPKYSRRLLIRGVVGTGQGSGTEEGCAGHISGVCYCRNDSLGSSSRGQNSSDVTAHFRKSTILGRSCTGYGSNNRVILEKATIPYETRWLQKLITPLTMRR